MKNNILTHFTEFSPFMEENDHIEISNSLNNKRLKINKIQAINMIKNLHNGMTEEDLKNLESLGILSQNSSNNWSNKHQIEHWDKRNWTQSLNYYMWSRNATFVDNGQSYNEIRQKTLQNFIKQNDLPPSPKKIDGQPIFLDEPVKDFKITLGEVLKKRSSVQSFKKITMPSQSLSNILYHSFKNISEERRAFNPDENILDLLKGVGYAYDMYLAIYDVEGFTPGLYFYEVETHQLELIKKGEYRLEVQKALIGQEAVLTANLTVIIVTNYARKQWRYRHERELRNIYIYAGQIVQRLLLVATAFETYCNITPAAIDSEYEHLLDLDNINEQVIYSVCIGKN